MSYDSEFDLAFSRENEISSDDDEGTKTFRQNLDKILNEGNKKRIIEYISSIISFTTFCIYITSTYYDPKDFTWFNYLDFCACSYFNLETLLNLYLAQHRLLYLIKVDTLVDLFTSTIPYLSIIDNFVLNKFIECSRTFRVIRLTRHISRGFKNNENEVAKQISIMIMSSITLILIFTLIYRIAEIDQIKLYLEDKTLSYDFSSQQYFHDFLYFIVVTLSTVGYGDIFPVTEQGRLVIILLIILALYLIPKQTNELIKLMGISSIYARAIYKSNPEVQHIVISGHVNIDALKNFCYELFHPDHGTQDKNAVIIQNNAPPQEMKVFLHAGEYEVSLRYLQGNPILEKDLKRSDILNAKACVIMTDKYSDDPHSTDHKNILLSLSIKKYFLYNEKDCQLFIQLIKPENKIHYQSGLQSFFPKNFNFDQVVIVEEIKMNLLSKSCLIPGIIAMISNLVISAGSQSEEFSSHWLIEYTEGRGHEIYRTLLNDSLKNKTFSKISSEIYKKYEAIVFAMEIEVEGKTIIRLNPGNFFIERLVNERDDVKIYIYIICSDKAVADTVSISLNFRSNLMAWKLTKSKKLQKNLLTQNMMTT